MEDGALNRIFDELESIRAQLRSMQESISSNIGLMMQEITGLKVWREGHEKRLEMLLEERDRRTAFVDGQIKELTDWQGRCEATLLTAVKHSDFVVVKNTQDEQTRIVEQAKGARKVWTAVVSLVGAALVIANLLHLMGGH